MKNLYLLCGVPGSGKSTWAHLQVEKSEKNIFYISRDEIRFSLLKPGEDYFSHEEEVTNTFYKKINKALLAPEVDCVIVDATHLNRNSRTRLLNSIIRGSYNIIPVTFNTSLETCLKRNSKREGLSYVPEKVIIDMYNRFRCPTFNEKYGYSSIITIEESNDKEVIL